MNTNERALLTQCAIAAAYQAGQRIANSDSDQRAVQKKAGGDSLASQVVTEVDISSQAIILQALKPTLQQFNLAVLSEEQPDDEARLHKDFFWCIDPLDGTLAFTESTPGYSVSIALVSQAGIPEIGVIYDPCKGNLYHAIKGQGAFKNSHPWKLQHSDNCFTFIHDHSFPSSGSDTENLASYKNIAEQLGYGERQTIFQGGAAMNAMWVLEHSPACYFKLPKVEPGGGSLWDFAASACIFAEVGAHVSDIYGAPLHLNRADTLFMHQHGVLYTSCSQAVEIQEWIQALHCNL